MSFRVLVVGRFHPINANEGCFYQRVVVNAILHRSVQLPRMLISKGQGQYASWVFRPYLVFNHVFQVILCRAIRRHNEGVIGPAFANSIAPDHPGFGHASVPGSALPIRGGVQGSLSLFQDGVNDGDDAIRRVGMVGRVVRRQRSVPSQVRLQAVLVRAAICLCSFISLPKCGLGDKDGKFGSGPCRFRVILGTSFISNCVQGPNAILSFVPLIAHTVFRVDKMLRRLLLASFVFRRGRYRRVVLKDPCVNGPPIFELQLRPIPMLRPRLCFVRRFLQIVVFIPQLTMNVNRNFRALRVHSYQRAYGCDSVVGLQGAAIQLRELRGATCDLLVSLSFRVQDGRPPNRFIRLFLYVSVSSHGYRKKRRRSCREGWCWRSSRDDPFVCSSAYRPPQYRGSMQF